MGFNPLSVEQTGISAGEWDKAIGYILGNQIYNLDEWKNYSLHNHEQPIAAKVFTKNSMDAVEYLEKKIPEYGAWTEEGKKLFLEFLEACRSDIPRVIGALGKKYADELKKGKKQKI